MQAGGTLGAWQVASMAYAPSKLASSKGMFRKLPSTGSQSVARPSCGAHGKTSQVVCFGAKGPI